MTADSTIAIGLLLPDVLGTYSDAGNATVPATAVARHPGPCGALRGVPHPAHQPAIGEIVTRCELAGVGMLCGFENHRGATTLGPEASPLGRVLSGVGNGNRRIGHGTEGVAGERIIGTYLHGPVLARNPALADHILSRATGQRLPAIELRDQAEQRGHYLGARPHRRSGG
jgi:lipid II isoglutaminyl synthase (glutamine-hydrolysing)